MQGDQLLWFVPSSPFQTVTFEIGEHEHRAPPCAHRPTRPPISRSLACSPGPLPSGVAKSQDRRSRAEPAILRCRSPSVPPDGDQRVEMVLLPIGDGLTLARKIV